MARIGYEYAADTEISLADINDTILTLESLLGGFIDADNIGKDSSGTRLTVSSTRISDVDGYIRGRKLIGNTTRLAGEIGALEEAVLRAAMPTTITSKISYELTKDSEEMSASLEVDAYERQSGPDMVHEEYSVSTTNKTVSVEKPTDYRHVTAEEFFGLVYDNLVDNDTALTKEKFIWDNCNRFNVAADEPIYSDELSVKSFRFDLEEDVEMDINFSLHLGKAEFETDRILIPTSFTMRYDGNVSKIPTEYFVHLLYRRTFMLRRIV